MKNKGKTQPRLMIHTSNAAGQQEYDSSYNNVDSFRNFAQNIAGPSLHVNANISHHVIECLKSILHYVKVNLLPRTHNINAGKNFKNLTSGENTHFKGKDIKLTMKNL